MENLRAALDIAAAGHAAMYGERIPNLYAEAAAEIERLDEIEEHVRWLVSTDLPVPGEYHRDPRRFIEERHARGLALLEAVLPKGSK